MPQADNPTIYVYLCLMIQGLERKDTYLHKGLRKKLIDTLKEKGIEDEQVLEAMMQVPRHFFLDPAFEHIAYEDRAFPIAAEQTISQPYTVAYQTALLQPKPFEKILEIGTGSAYQSCVLAALGAFVYTIERQRKLYEQNENFFYLKKFPRIKRFYGDGFEGLPTYAPFDKIIITAAAPFLPPNLFEQLKEGGVMVVPVNDDGNNVQKMKRITKKNNHPHEESLDDFSFVPMLQGRQNQ